MVLKYTEWSQAFVQLVIIIETTRSPHHFSDQKKNDKRISKRVKCEVYLVGHFLSGWCIGLTSLFKCQVADKWRTPWRFLAKLEISKKFL